VKNKRTNINKGAEIMTAQELLAIARSENPSVKYVTNAKRTAIGAWSADRNRYTPVAGLLLTGQWVEMGDLLINGTPCITDWDETL
jgi:hypothetical protein